MPQPNTDDIVVDLPPELYALAKEGADQNNMSVQDYVRRLVTADTAGGRSG